MNAWQDFAVLAIVVAALAYLGRVVAGWWRGKRGPCAACPLHTAARQSPHNPSASGGIDDSETAMDSEIGLKKKQPRRLVQIDPPPRR